MCTVQFSAHMSTVRGREIRHSGPCQAPVVHTRARYDADMSTRPRARSRHDRVRPEATSRGEGKELTRAGPAAGRPEAAVPQQLRQHQPAGGHPRGRHQPDRVLPPLRRHGGARPRPRRAVLRHVVATCCASARTDAAHWPDAIRGSVDVVVRHVARARAATCGSSPASATAACAASGAPSAASCSCSPTSSPSISTCSRSCGSGRPTIAACTPGLIAEIMVHMVAELLEADAGEREQLQQRTIAQMRLVSLAIPAWRPDRS